MIKSEQLLQWLKLPLLLHHLQLVQQLQHEFRLEMERLILTSRLKMVVLSYSLSSSLYTLVLACPSTTIFVSLSMISIISNSFHATALRDQQDMRKIVLEQRESGLVSSLNQLNQLIFFFFFIEELFF